MSKRNENLYESALIRGVAKLSSSLRPCPKQCENKFIVCNLPFHPPRATIMQQIKCLSPSPLV